jgi:hypothetical protein
MSVVLAELMSVRVRRDLGSRTNPDRQSYSAHDPPLAASTRISAGPVIQLGVDSMIAWFKAMPPGSPEQVVALNPDFEMYAQLAGRVAEPGLSPGAAEANRREEETQHRFIAGLED